MLKSTTLPQEDSLSSQAPMSPDPRNTSFSPPPSPPTPLSPIPGAHSSYNRDAFAQDGARLKKFLSTLLASTAGRPTPVGIMQDQLDDQQCLERQGRERQEKETQRMKDEAVARQYTELQLASETKYRDLESTSKADKGKLVSCSFAMKNLEATVKDRTQRIAQLETEGYSSQAEVETLRATNKDLAMSVQGLKMAHTQLSQSTKSLVSKHQSINETLTALKNRSEEVKDKADRCKKENDRLKAQMKADKKKAETSLGNVQNFRSKLKELEGNLKLSTTECSRLKAAAAGKDKEVVTAKQSRNNLLSMNGAIRQCLNAEKVERETFETVTHELREVNRELGEELATLKESQFQTESTLNTQISRLEIENQKLKAPSSKRPSVPESTGDGVALDKAPPKRSKMTIPSLDTKCAICNDKAFGLMRACEGGVTGCARRLKVHAHCAARQNGGGNFKCEECESE